MLYVVDDYWVSFGAIDRYNFEFRNVCLNFPFVFEIIYLCDCSFGVVGYVFWVAHVANGYLCDVVCKGNVVCVYDWFGKVMYVERV